MKYYNRDTQKLPLLAILRKNYTELKIPGTTVQHTVKLQYKSSVWSDAMDTQNTGYND